MRTPSAATSLILHGHFYQPPRENPDTGIVPQQRSAHPATDWNTRITHECYRANAFSRYLTYDGRISAIVNTYEYLSFNFGPTLLHWLLENFPDTYDRIIEADAQSVRRFGGHGNAIAQGYNHTILPLDSWEDARLQIAWGLEDFTHHFKRKAEGIWLPEAAIDQRIIDLLEKEGVSFVILSPWQAEAVEERPGGGFIPLKDRPAPYHTPYLLETTQGGTISVFFYEPELASGISFGHFLRDADALLASIRKLATADGESSIPLIHTATDGEIYGHHEPYGDMCLAALIRKVNASDDVRFTNYGQYLEQTPPTLKARLKAGEGGKGTSWSCAHGVSRWYKDCGCKTGGDADWTQGWRGPLRTAFERLAVKLKRIFQANSHLFYDHDPQEVLRAYGAVLSGRIEPERFIQGLIADQQKELDPCQRTAMLMLLEGQKFSKYMFTSCGWFFSDLSGIEPRQNIRYAFQAIQLYQRFTEEDLYSSLAADLESALSNVKEVGSGKDILASSIPSLQHGAESAAYFAMNRMVARPDRYIEHYGIFRLEEIDHIEGTKNTFSVKVYDTSLACAVKFLVLINDGTDRLTIDIMQDEPKKVCSSWFPHNEIDQNHMFITMDELPDRFINCVYTWIDDSLHRVPESDMETISRDLRWYTHLNRNGLLMPDDNFYSSNMGTCIRTLCTIYNSPDCTYAYRKRTTITDLLAFVQQNATELDTQSVLEIISQHMDETTERLRRSRSADDLVMIRDLIIMYREFGLLPRITKLQEIIYDMFVQTAPRSDEALIEMAKQIGIAVD